MSKWPYIQKAVSDPAYMRGVIYRLSTKWNRVFHKHFVSHRGIDVIDQDWDNLIILDGCRNDLFQNVCWLDGKMRSVESKATESQKFLQRNFVGRNLHDAVYISANPYAHKLPDKTFHDVINVYNSGWNEDLQTVTPETMADSTIQAHRDYPNKRLVAHFMQPHYPFIGEVGQKIDESSIGGMRGEKNEKMNIWSKLMYGREDLDQETVWKAYAENLTIALEEVERLIDSIEGKTVITSDHGNLVGDTGYPIPVPGFGHPPDYFLKSLTQVPWFTVDGNRREIEPDPPVETEQEKLGETVRQERLQSLGYID